MNYALLRLTVWGLMVWTWGWVIFQWVPAYVRRMRWTEVSPNTLEQFVTGNPVFVFVTGILAVVLCHLLIINRKATKVLDQSDHASQRAPVPHAPCSGTNATAPTEQVQTSIPQVRPWIRFWARLFDAWVFGLVFPFVVIGLISIVAPEFNFKDVVLTNENELLFGMASILVWVFVEALLLSSLGTTPGKWLFKIKLIPAAGSLPTYRAALSRSIEVWWRGLWAGIPVLFLGGLASAYGRLAREGITSWDKHGGFTVVHEKIGVGKGSVAAACLIFLLTMKVAGNVRTNSLETFNQIAEELSSSEESHIDRLPGPNGSKGRWIRVPDDDPIWPPGTRVWEEN